MYLHWLVKSFWLRGPLDATSIYIPLELAGRIEYGENGLPTYVQHLPCTINEEAIWWVKQNNLFEGLRSGLLIKGILLQSEHGLSEKTGYDLHITNHELATWMGLGFEKPNEFETNTGFKVEELHGFQACTVPAYIQRQNLDMD